MDNSNEIMKQKKVNFFTAVPQSSSELKEGYHKIGKEKESFVHLSLIPRKSNGDIDWINYWEKYWAKPLPFSSTEAEIYLKNKTNPALQKWLKKFAVGDDISQDQQISLLNEGFNEHIEINLNAKDLFQKLGSNDASLTTVKWMLIYKFTGGKEVSTRLNTHYLVPPP